MKKNKVCVVGLGYIGLPTALLMAERGFNVKGCDLNPTVINCLNSGQSHIVEAGIDHYLNLAMERKNFVCDTSPQRADIFIIAVPTPVISEENGDQSGKACDLSYVISAVESIAKLLEPGNTLIIESTCSVGATDEMVNLLGELRPDLNTTDHSSCLDDHLYIAYCPERVLPGKTFEELISNDRIVGGVTPEAAREVQGFYESFVEGTCLVTDAKTAEISKLTENAFRDVNIAFANELANICDAVQIDVWELISLANRHPRVNILEPGPGVGGHCIAVDPWFLAAAAPNDSPLITTARRVNDERPARVVSKIETLIRSIRLGETEKSGKTLSVGLFGISFKPNIDDFRESPSLEVLRLLKQSVSNISLLAIDPYIDKKEIEGVPMCEIDFALENVDIAVMLVRHNEFKDISLKTPYALDLKGCLAHR